MGKRSGDRFGAEDALHAILENHDVEVDKESQGQVSHLEVARHLLAIDWGNELAGIGLQNKLRVDQKIQSDGSDRTSLVVDYDAILPLKRDPLRIELQCERILVCLLRKARSQLAMHINAN